ncbi:uncharacterized protein LOC107402858 [Peromyscus maniculatus bairdii]|uniref:uncharacterized protein LOC107402858 n=1 Tax=Peromyscus maniculatus bairdii TaxID=230844 RepID=UPI00077DAA5F|nr:translation initiation factor IF-2-like [Peromyscus maniculatus bairdii]
MQLPGHARVRRRPSHHLSLPRSPASLVPPRSSHPIPPPRSLCRSRPLSSPGSPVPHVPSPSSSRSRAPSPATHLSAFSEVPKPRGWTRTPPALPRPKPGRFTCAPPCSTSTSQASRRPAEGRRSSSVRSGPGPHAHHPGLRSLTHVSPRPLKEPHCSVRPEAERRALPVYAMTQARSAKSSGSTLESMDSAAAWRGSRGVGEVASLPPACLTLRLRRPGLGREWLEAGCRLRTGLKALQ